MWDVRSLLPDDGAIWYGTEGPEPRQIFWVTDRGDALTSYASSRFWAAEMLLGDAGSLHVLGGSGSGGWIETLDIETGTLTRLGYAPRSSSTLRCVGGALWWRTPSAVFTLPVDGSAGPRAVAVGTTPVGLIVDESSVVWIDGWRGELPRLQWTLGHRSRLLDPNAMAPSPGQSP